MIEDSSWRVTLGKMQNPVRGLLHGAAALASIPGAILLWLWSSDDLSRQISLLVFGISLTCLYTVSSLYHSVPWNPLWKARMQRVDHAMIYVLVAGTYTPIVWVGLDGWVLGAALGAVWGIALLGILQKLFWPGLRAAFSIGLQTLQGWIGVLLFLPLSEKLPAQAIGLIFLGGVFYTVGLIFYVTRQPRLWPRVFSYHEVFHVCVVAGSIAHFSMATTYLLPLPPM